MRCEFEFCGKCEAQKPEYHRSSRSVPTRIYQSGFFREGEHRREHLRSVILELSTLDDTWEAGRLLEARVDSQFKYFRSVEEANCNRAAVVLFDVYVHVSRRQ